MSSNISEYSHFHHTYNNSNSSNLSGKHHKHDPFTCEDSTSLEEYCGKILKKQHHGRNQHQVLHAIYIV